MDSSKPIYQPMTGTPAAPKLSHVAPTHVPEPAGSIAHFHQLIASGELATVLDRLGKVKR